jgi:polysaccharide deacetylase 2 family uncharacterized protein YibQ
MSKQKHKRHAPPNSFVQKKFIIAATLLISVIGLFIIGLIVYDVHKTDEQIAYRSELFKQHLGGDESTQKDTKSALQELLRIEREKDFYMDVEESEREEPTLPSVKPIAKQPEIKVLPKPIKEAKIVSKVPKLAIVFDDVANKNQVKSIQSMGLRVNMSFFPYASTHPYTPKLAKNQPFHLVHLPLEAMRYSNTEPSTLYVDDSYETIESGVKSILKDYPGLKYLNNHTGSKFTSNEEAMRKLLQVFQKYDLHFLDSRTTAKTVVEKISGEMGVPYLRRDVFLDHKNDVEYIKGQFQKAIDKAKKNGSAIAIGHPRKNTIEALKQSKSMLDGVMLVYLNEL